MTLSEKKLWAELRKLRPHIRRQVPIGRYIADFACHAARLVIEVDSARHDFDQAQRYDLDRTAWLESQGYKVVRFRDDAVFTDPTALAHEVATIIAERTGAPLPAVDPPSPLLNAVPSPSMGEGPGVGVFLPASPEERLRRRPSIPLQQSALTPLDGGGARGGGASAVASGKNTFGAEPASSSDAGALTPIPDPSPIEGEGSLSLDARAPTILGIETSCDETAAAVVRLRPRQPPEILSSVIHSQILDHAPFGGVVPEIAARAHVEAIDGVVARALADAGVTARGLDAIAATAGPGLVGGVMVGLSFAKAMALALAKPLIAVNHLEGHAVSARLTQDVPYPFLLLLVSGGHCQLLEVAGIGACARLGSTIDDAAGEAFDKIGGALGLSYPAGPALERLAAGGDPQRFALPRALHGREGCDFSFSGLKTAAARLAATLTSETDRRDLAAAAQAAITLHLTDRTAAAMRAYRERREPPVRFVVAGGVAANAAVRSALQALAAEHGFAFFAPPLAYCTDNAAMIALAGAERLAIGLTDGLDAVARPRWPLDEAAALARPTHKAGRKGAKA
jgi:N6-L-threonylcarbamoyladenine synthase